MARHYLRSAQSPSEDADARTSMDDLIRPGLTQAFPLPPEPQADERFSQILEALAQQRDRTK